MSPTAKTLLSKLFFWCLLEIVLNYVELDNLADYSEFITNQTSKLYDYAQGAVSTTAAG